MNRHVDSSLTSLDLRLKAAGGHTRSREDGSVVTTFVGVDHVDHVVLISLLISTYFTLLSLAGLPYRFRLSPFFVLIVILALILFLHVLHSTLLFGILPVA